MGGPGMTSPAHPCFDNLVIPQIATITEANTIRALAIATNRPVFVQSVAGWVRLEWIGGEWIETD